MDPTGHPRPVPAHTALEQRYLTRLTRHRDHATRTDHAPGDLPPGDRAALLRRLATEAIDRVSAQRAIWDTHHLRATVEQLLRDAPVPLADLDANADTLVEAALTPPLSQSLSETTHDHDIEAPRELRRRDGHTIYLNADTVQHTSAAVLDCENLIVDYGARRDGWSPPAPYPQHPTRPAAHDDTGPRLLVLPISYATDTERLAGHLARTWNGGGGNTLCVHAHPDPHQVARSGAHPDLRPGSEIHPLTGMRQLLDDRAAAPAWTEHLGRRTLLIVLNAATAGAPDLGALLRRVLHAGGTAKLLYDELPKPTAVPAAPSANNSSHNEPPIVATQPRPSTGKGQWRRGRSS